jgi:hypothetical protein
MIVKSILPIFKIIKESQSTNFASQNDEGTITNGQYREIGNIGIHKTKKNKTKTQHNTRWTPSHATKHK